MKISRIDDTANNKPVIRTSRQNFGYFVSNVIFSRDCLEIDLNIGGKILTFLINHLKAQDATPGSSKRRTEQAKRVSQIVDGVVAAKKFPIVMGDMNMDIRQQNYDGSLDVLIKNKNLADHFEKDTWTHYYVPQKKKSRLNYILIDKRIKHISHSILAKDLLQSLLIRMNRAILRSDPNILKQVIIAP